MGLQTPQQLQAEATRLAPTLRAVSHAIHSHPEMRFEEYQSSRILVDALRDNGFEVEAPLGGLPTAFRATAGHGGPTIAVLCEYDAIEDLGHACGHNIIAAAGLGAFLLTARQLTETTIHGRVVIIGTPAEEGGGGKVRLLEAGVFDDIDAAMLIHPSSLDCVTRTCPARVILEASYHGQAAHAGAAPHLGRNALDAVTLANVAIGLLRQQLEDNARVHGIVTEGGQAANTIPERASLRLQLRSPCSQYLLERLKPAVENCLRAAALATETELRLNEPVPVYDALRPNSAMEALVGRAFTALGRTPSNPRGLPPWGSTDMGNISQRLPAIHPFIRVSDQMLEHSRPAVDAAASPDGDRAVIDGAAILASSALQLIANPALLAAARQDFEGHSK